MEIQVTDFDEMLAVWEAEIEGFVYDDGDVYADIDALEAWRAAHPKSHTCRGCGILSREPICPNCRHTDEKYGTRTAVQQ